MRGVGDERGRHRAAEELRDDERESKRYQIKADQIRCATAKTYARRYLSRHSRPSGYRCTDFTSSTKLKFRCAKGVRVFFAIKR